MEVKPLRSFRACGRGGEIVERDWRSRCDQTEEASWELAV